MHATSRSLSILFPLFVLAMSAGCASSTTPGFNTESSGEDDTTIVDPLETGEETAAEGGLEGGVGLTDIVLPDPTPDTGETSGEGGSGELCTEAPFEFGCPCDENEDCATGWCIDGPNGLVCTETCLDECPDGWNCLPIVNVGGDSVYVCAPEIVELCAACVHDTDCGGADDFCAAIGDTGSFCTSNCDADGACPTGYTCTETTGFAGSTAPQCVPTTDSCVCTVDLIGSSKPCAITNEAGKCYGEQVCSGSAGWSDCSAAEPALEICDGVDNDCDGFADEGVAGTACVKTSAFGACDGVTVCDGTGNAICDASEPLAETCDGLDNDCDELTDEDFPDNDGDGDADCVDTDDDDDQISDTVDNCPLVPNPDQLDTDGDGTGDACEDDFDGDGVLNEEDNCDLVANPDQEDLDNDGTGDACDEDIDGDSYLNTEDCHPKNPQWNPGAAEICDGIDNNCDGVIDEADAVGCTNAFEDMDLDGYGGDETICVCTLSGGWSPIGGDCDDLNPEASPVGTEVCDDADNDCNGVVDDNTTVGCLELFKDTDGDGYGANGDSQCLCGPEGDYNVAKSGDCNDSDPTVNPMGVEACDGLDNDCAGGIDDGQDNAGCSNLYQDVDGDGFGPTSTEQCLCGPTGDWDTAASGDCNDNAANAHPGAPETCDGIDNDCDSLIDENCDTDGDGYCAGEVPPGGVAAAVCPNGGGDCNDTNPAIHPGIPEVCDGIDNDCVGGIDNGVASPCGGCTPVCVLDVGAQGDEDWNPDGINGMGVNEDGDLALESSAFSFHMLWAANSPENTISRIDTESGLEVGRYKVCSDPSRTAVDLDGNGWAACRGDGKVVKIIADPFSCPDLNGNGVVETSTNSNPLPLGQDECVAFNMHPGSGVNKARAIGIDAENHAWVGFWNQQLLIRISPAGSVVQTISIGVHPYGLAIDASGIIWVAARSNAALTRVDPGNGSVQHISYPNGNNLYGIAVDQEGDVWIGNCCNNNVAWRYRPSNGQWASVSLSFSRPRGIVAGTDGNVYVALDTDNRVARIDKATMTATGYASLGSGKFPVGITIDSGGNVWVVNQSGNSATRVNPNTMTVLNEVPVGSSPYTYSDMTGFLLKTVTAPEGIYTHVFHGWEEAPTQWAQVSASTLKPEGTEVTLRYRAADTIGGLGNVAYSAVQGPYPPAEMPLNLLPLNVTGRFLQVEVTLKSSESGSTPVLQNMEAVAATATP